MSGEWIEHDGRGMPVPSDTIVDVRDRDGTEWVGYPADFHEWKYGTDFPNEEVASYRIASQASLEA
ncbi:hypothetical protein [Sinorhizobium meliloti]|uniref:hypothetical protein n=1 Tax=Rhizobium meliloti TaxID=382 RepID=UPI000FD6D335|nr:hypothetical protein [Sinorhizobium meliloti]RVQ10032.1 hypothetical protein CN067_34025 [Sinorhizobium meliloti]RVQ55748.1 hypothetical protein CN060_21105 [Sinorhizobium meliloti]